MASIVQPLPQVTQTVQTNGKYVEPNAPVPTQVNDGPTPGNPTIPAGARSITANTMVGFSNDNLAHVCDFVSEMQKSINLKKYFKSIAQQIRKAIRAVLRALGFSDATGEASWLANTLKSIAREVNYINKQILQPIIDFERYVVAYIAKLREMIAWILSLPAKFLALLQDCLARLLKLIGSVFSDIGAGLSQGFSEGPSDYDQIIKEAKELAGAAENTVRLTATAVAGAVNVAGSATLGLLIPASQAELEAANNIIQAYESSTPPKQNKSTP
jgi:hypothetical protein